MGEIITFYSFKGGTGRSMALANTAVLLARQGKRVLMIDWDLEAPGLDAYFDNRHPNIQTAPGLIEFITFADKMLDKVEYGNETAEQFNPVFHILSNYILKLDLPNFPTNNSLSLLKAGELNDTYQNRIHKFNWKNFYKKVPAFFALFAEFISTQFDFVLIDSRTGHTDMSSICTALMPEKLVLVFTPNLQSLNGVLKIAKNATDYRLKSDDLRPLMIYPLPSKVDLAEEDLKKEWEGRYSRAFEDIFSEIYSPQRGISLSSYFSQVQIRYSPRMSYGEYISALDLAGGPNSLTENYECFVAQILGEGNIWEYRQITTPFELTLIFDGKIKNTADELLRYLNPLVRTNMLKWELENIQPIESLNPVDIRKITTRKENHLMLVLIDDALQIAEYNWQEIVSKVLTAEKNGNTIVLPIWVNSNLQEITYQLFKDKLILPNRRTPLQKMSNKDEAWTNITSEIRKQISRAN